MHGAGEFSASPGRSVPVVHIGDEQRGTAQLTAGAVLGFPTETVWGLGVSASRPTDLARLRHRKGRVVGKAFQLLCADPEAALSLVDAEFRPRLVALAPFWPGPLTLVVPAAPGCPEWLTSGGQVGLRVPDHAVPRWLAALAGGVFVGSSYNRSGLPPATTQAQAIGDGLADLLIAGATAEGVPSTVFDAGRGLVLRAGGTDPDQLLEAWRCGR